MTLIHETGHTLGLKHSGDYFRGDEPGPYLPYADDNITNTVMSYNFAGNSSAMLMPYDILALQYLYGDKEPNRGNTTYTFANVYQYSDGVYNRGAANPMKLTISDRGGIDTIDLSALSAENSGYYIDLTLGGLITTQDAFKASSYDSYGTSFGPYYTSTYGTRLDYETLIENLISTSNNDKIIGNQAINHISAGAGNDTVESGAGNDTLFGDKGIDQLDGDTGNDVLIGGAGDDSLTGGGGQDQFVMKQGDGIDIITDFGGIGRGGIPSAATVAEVDMLKFDDRGLTAGKMLLNESGVNLEITFDGVKDTKVILQNFQLEKLENFKNLGNISFDGQNLIQDSFDVINSDSQQPSIWSPNTVTFLNNLDNNIQGFDASDDVVNGQGGNDTIRGLSGNDTLRGGDGNDRLDGGNGNDTLIGMDGNDILVGGSGKDASSGGAGVDSFTFSALSESLLASIDVITDYASLDCIDAPNSVLAATLTTSVGTAAILSAAAISTVLTSGVFSANSACAFTVAGESGTFIALNNGTAGFNATDDSIIQLHGYSLGSVVIV